MKAKLIAAALAVLMLESAAALTEITWKGASTGGNWGDAANWNLPSGVDITTALSSGSYQWTVTGLADGATLYNNSTTLKIGGFKYAPDSAATITLKDADGTSDCLFGGDAVLTLNENATINFQLHHSQADANTSKPKIVVNGVSNKSGKIVFAPDGTFTTWGRDIQPCADSTVVLSGDNLDLANTSFTSWNTSTLEVETDVTASRVTQGQNCKLVLKDGKTLHLGSGEAASTSAVETKLATSGMGNLVFSGGQDYTWTGSLGYSGYLRMVNGAVSFGSGVTVPSANEVKIDGSGKLAFASAQTLGALSGTGATGKIEMGDSTTLTVGTANAADSTFAGSIGGKVGLVKAGEGYELTLTGANTYEGATKIEAGTLGIKRCNYRSGLVAGWSFADKANLGADYGPTGVPLTLAAGSGVITQIVDGMSHRPAIHLAPNGAASKTYLYVDKDVRTAANGFALNTSARCFSFWMKPNLDKSAAGGNDMIYIVREGVYNEGEGFMLWYDTPTKKFHLMIDQWNTSNTSDLNVYGEASDIGDGNWHHVVASYENKHLALWYDGKLLGESTTSDALNVGTITTDANTLVFGDNAGNHQLDSYLADVCVRNHALTESEVKREYALKGGMASEADVLPAPIAHWKFDDDANIGKDETGNTDLVAVSGLASPSLVATGSPDGKALSGALTVANGAYPKGLPTGTAPFSVSLKVLANGVGTWQSLVSWGGTTEQTRFAAYYKDSPRRLDEHHGRRNVLPELPQRAD